MHCPKCAHEDTKVLDTRIGKGNLSIRRRRQCLSCEHRFTTIEEILREGLFVTKRDGAREEFDRAKMISGLRKATEKRPVEVEQVEILIAEVIDTLEREYDSEIPSQAIGKEIMNRLKQIDKISYVRYASVYKEFKDIEEFEKEISELRAHAH